MLKEDCALIVIDFQERLVPHISGIDKIIKNSRKLIKACKIFGIPIIVTEQRKLGNTIKEIKELLDLEPIPKLTFSCVKEKIFKEKIKNLNKSIFILIGIEAHICILQTALDLIKEGYTVYVPFDCVGSRNDFDKEVALQRMIKEGVIPATVESIIFEMLQTAEAEEFKEILNIVKE
ncbi:MAG TPA: hydrolase [Archaeoglobus profundus]|nr:hydrolase [Archaeoglobus profundus]HIP58287.1 hydrolase [Archaeoglobus profundus]